MQGWAKSVSGPELEGTYLAAALDAVRAHVAVLDGAGVIVHVNRAWRRFASENGWSGGTAGVGTSYLAVCEGDGVPPEDPARALAGGIRRVLDGSIDAFEVEYPCHAPGVPRWFVARVEATGAPPRLLVVTHENVTARKLAEAALGEQAVAKGVAQRLLRALGTGSVQAAEKRRLGQAIARDAGLASAAGFLDAFVHMGLGELTLAGVERDRYTFRGRALVEHTQPSMVPACHVTLGYLEGAVEQLTGRPTLGSEVRCQAQGHAQCTFLVQAREPGDATPSR